MRIIAGSLKGRHLAGPDWEGLRPTSDSLRETLFNILGPSVAGAVVLDGFAGTGALGLEALSRGASRVTFVESDRRAVLLLNRNLKRCGVDSACEVLQDSFFDFAPRNPEPRNPNPEPQNPGTPEPALFDLVLLDPPYDETDLDAVLRAAASLLAPAGRLVLEHSRRRHSPPEVGPLRRTRVVQAGDSALSFYQ